jgi:uncharacterized protein (TIGR03437 family)
MRLALMRIILLLIPLTLAAAPRLRISTASIGPLNVAAGTDGPAQTVLIQNAGDGSLNLSASSTAAWLVPTLSADRLQVALSTASLARGMYTGAITLSDPNAIDAPQNLTVTVQIGGGVPDRMDFTLAPGGSAQQQFISNCPLTRVVAAPAAGPTLALALQGNGSFTFTCTYTVSAAAAAAVGEGDYSGSLTLDGSKFASDNKTVPVGIHVTSQPIAQVIPANIKFRIAQGAAVQTVFLQVANTGLGNLNLTSVSTQSSGGQWLQAQIAGSFVQVTGNAAGLAAGIYTGQTTVNTNAFNGTIVVPVELDVLAPGAPITTVGAIVDNSTFTPGDPLPAGGIVALFGDQLSTGAPQQASSLPLATSLGGATVFVNSQPAPLYYVSANQINFQMPFETSLGEAFVRVDRDGQRGNTVGVEVTGLSPRILTLPFGNYAVAVNAADQSLVIPSTPGLNGHPAKSGDTITIYAIGLGATSPSVASGAAAPSVEPLARVTNPVQVYFTRGIFTNYVVADPLFAGLTPGFVGLYQINVVVPQDGRKGDSVLIYILLPNAESNHVNLALQ